MENIEIQTANEAVYITLNEQEDLLEKFSHIKFEDVKNPTFLEILKQSRRETLWSNLLVFFLDPQKEHHLADLFIKTFIEVSGETIEITDLKGIKVKPEISTENRKRIDIVIDTKKCVIGIENKIDHFLNNPLEDYSQKLVELANGRKVIKIILSVNHCKESHGFKNITYQRLVARIEENLPAYEINADPTYLMFLKDFLRNIKNIQSYTHMLSNRKALEFFKDNYDSLDGLTSRFIEFKQLVVHLFKKFHEAIDDQQINAQLKVFYGDFASIEKGEIEDDGASFFIEINIGSSKPVLLSIYLTETKDIYGYAFFYDENDEENVIDGYKIEGLLIDDIQVNVNRITSLINNVIDDRMLNC